MNLRKASLFGWTFTMFLLIALLAANQARAHCDGLDGPVVQAAREALETENVDLVLIWVQPEFEEQIKSAFEKVLAVRKLSPQAKDLADMYFFETLVRLHRAGEGAPYDGLKPAGRNLGPVIPAADKSIETGSDEDLLKLLTDAIHEGIEDHFQEVVGKKNYETRNIEAGRQYVESYVVFVHYVEGIYEAVKKSDHGDLPESEEADLH